MSRINTNVSALISARVLGANNQKLNKTLERLSTGYRINGGSDDPAGLIASERLRGELSAIKSAMGNAERASGIVSTAEGALAEISDKLVEMQELIAGAASSGGLTAEEIKANQTQIDGIITSINRIANETSFNGDKLLDGSKGFKTTTTNAYAQNVSVNMAKGIQDADFDVDIAVATEATQASLAVAATNTGGAENTVTYEITGYKGSATLTFGDGATAADISNAVMAVRDVTGVYSSGAANLVADGYGEDYFVRVEIIDGTDAGGITTGYDEGSDAVVTINGVNASVDGYQASVRTETLDISFTMTDDLVSDDTKTETITIEKGGGATFLLSPNVGLGGQETIGINAVHAYRLGDDAIGTLADIATGKSKDLTTNAEDAQKIVAAAIEEVATMRGRLGSFLNNTVDMTINSLGITYENVAAAESVIRDTDFAEATAELTRNQVLVQAANSVLGIAASTPQSVLGLL
ncbi:MAG: flagellin [Planctomycetes bacterium]|nr:flagellin [Planctomycetota bacterium]